MTISTAIYIEARNLKKKQKLIPEPYYLCIRVRSEVYKRFVKYKKQQSMYGVFVYILIVIFLHKSINYKKRLVFANNFFLL